MAATAVTLNDLEGHSPVVCLFKCNLRIFVQHFTRFQLTVCSHGFSALAELLVIIFMRINWLNLTKIAAVIRWIPCAVVQKYLPPKKVGDNSQWQGIPFHFKSMGACPPVHPRIYVHESLKRYCLYGRLRAVAARNTTSNTVGAESASSGV